MDTHLEIANGEAWIAAIYEYMRRSNFQFWWVTDPKTETYYVRKAEPLCRECRHMDKATVYTVHLWHFATWDHVMAEFGFDYRKYELETSWLYRLPGRVKHLGLAIKPTREAAIAMANYILWYKIASQRTPYLKTAENVVVKYMREHMDEPCTYLDWDWRVWDALRLIHAEWYYGELGITKGDSY